MAELRDRSAVVLNCVRSARHDPLHVRSLCRLRLYEDVLLPLGRRGLLHLR